MENAEFVFITMMSYGFQKNIMIQKKLISIFNEINEIDAYVINNYDGRYMVDGLKIGINLEFRDELQNDFYNITNLTLADIMELLR